MYENKNLNKNEVREIDEEKLLRIIIVVIVLGILVATFFGVFGDGKQSPEIQDTEPNSVVVESNSVDMPVP